MTLYRITVTGRFYAPTADLDARYSYAEIAALLTFPPETHLKVSTSGALFLVSDSFFCNAMRVPSNPDLPAKRYLSCVALEVDTSPLHTLNAVQRLFTEADSAQRKGDDLVSRIEQEWRGG